MCAGGGGEWTREIFIGRGAWDVRCGVSKGQGTPCHYTQLAGILDPELGGEHRCSRASAGTLIIQNPQYMHNAPIFEARIQAVPPPRDPLGVFQFSITGRVGSYTAPNRYSSSQLRCMFARASSPLDSKRERENATEERMGLSVIGTIPSASIPATRARSEWGV